MDRKVSFIVLAGFLLLATTATAQENSPYSRYGIGDLQPGQHILNRGMGGVSVAYADPQAVNISNVASFASLRIVTYDLGISVDSRTLRNAGSALKFNSTNFAPSYLALGIPINRKKEIGAALGIRPLTRINYSIIKSERLSGIDSLQTLYEGSGGLNQVFFGIARKWSKQEVGLKKSGLSVGIMGGYNFGRKETATKIALINDTVAYYKGNYSTATNFGGAFVNAGVQYEHLMDTFSVTGKGKMLRYVRFGATGTLGQTLWGKQDTKRETFNYDANGGTYVVDSVYAINNVRGRIEVPATYTVGFTFLQSLNGLIDVWSVGAEFTSTQWSKYRFYKQADAVTNNWQLRIGGQWTPDPFNVRNYLSRVSYRTGFNIGKDYINADGKELKTYGVTFGFGFPVRQPRFNPNQFTTVHTAIEFGKRGSKANAITENYFRFSLGLSLSDIWFIKRRYD